MRRGAITGTWLLLGRHALGIAISFAGSLIVIRLTGPTTWGLYAVSLFVLGAMQEILVRGLTLYLIRKPEPLRSEEISTAWSLQQILGITLSSFIVLLASPVAHAYGHPDLRLLIVGAAFGGFGYSVRAVPIALFERELAYAKVGIVEITDTLTFNIVAVIGAISGHALGGLAWANALRGILPSLIALVLLRRRITFRLAPDARKSLVAFGLPAIGVNLVNIVIAAAPILLIGRLVGVEALGFVQLGFSILGYTLLPISTIARVAMSAYARVQRDSYALHQALRRTVWVVLFILVPSVALIAGLSPAWTLIYGPRWLPVAEVIVAGVLGYLLGGVFLPVSSVLFALGRPRDVFWFLIFLCLVYWAASMLLVSRLAYLSAPVAWSIAHLAAYPMLLYKGARASGPLDYWPLAQGLLVGVVVTFGTWLLSRSVLGAFVAVVALGAFTVIWIAYWSEPRRWLRAAVAAP